MEPEHKLHKLQTIQDLVDVVTRQNIDCLLGDLRNHLVMAMTAQETGCFVMNRPGVMNWIDSGRCDVFLSAPNPSGVTAQKVELKPAVQAFDARLTRATQRLLKEALAQSGGDPSTVVHRHDYQGSAHVAPTVNENKEAWISSEDEDGNNNNNNNNNSNCC